MIEYKIGDATGPFRDIDAGPKILIHCCNSKGLWGAGFVLAVSKKWPEPEALFRKNFKEDFSKLGDIQVCAVETDFVVVNMIGQEIGWKDGQPPIRYWAIEQALKKVARLADWMGASIVAPRFGSALAGGDWNKIEELINKNLGDFPVYIFDLPTKEKK